MTKDTRPIDVRWVEALRSGRYKQTRSVLRNPDTGGMCCLGVVCDLVEPFGWDGIDEIGEVRGVIHGKVGDPDHHSCSSTSLYAKIREKVGLRTGDGEFVVPASGPVYEVVRKHSPHDACKGAICTLVRLNDNLAPFEEIAVVIENKPEGLFV